MARGFLAADNDFVYAAGPVLHGIDTGDFTIGFRIYCTAALAYDGCWANGTYAPAIYAHQTGSGPWSVWWGADYVFDTTLSTGQWYGLAIKRSGSTLYGYVNGVQESTTHTKSTSMANAPWTWANQQTTPSAFDLNGRLAECAGWTEALSTDEIAGLADGFCPLSVRPGSLIGYWPMGGRYGENDIDVLGNYDLTVNATPTWEEHPPTFYPGGVIQMPHVAAAPPSTVIPVLMNQHRRRRVG